MSTLPVRNSQLDDQLSAPYLLRLEEKGLPPIVRENVGLMEAVLLQPFLEEVRGSYDAAYHQPFNREDVEEILQRLREDMRALYVVYSQTTMKEVFTDEDFGQLYATRYQRLEEKMRSMVALSSPGLRGGFNSLVEVHTHLLKHPPSEESRIRLADAWLTYALPYTILADNPWKHAIHA